MPSAIRAAVIRTIVANPLLRFLFRQDTYRYWRHRLGGGNHADFYGERQDNIIRNHSNDIDAWIAERKWQLDYLIKTNIINPRTDFLDYGCGTVAAGVHIVGYLDRTRYVGCDVSQESLKLGRSHIARLGLEAKEPTLLHLPSGSLQPLGDRKFDVIWAQSVLAHMPGNLIRDLIVAIPRYLKPGGAFYATVNWTDGPNHRDGQVSFWFNKEFWDSVAAGAGLAWERRPDWYHATPSPWDRLIKFSAKR
jgi:SAM-dependent methyltransferase